MGRLETEGRCQKVHIHAHAAKLTRQATAVGSAVSGRRHHRHQHQLAVSRGQATQSIERVSCSVSQHSAAALLANEELGHGEEGQPKTDFTVRKNSSRGTSLQQQSRQTTTRQIRPYPPLLQQGDFDSFLQAASIGDMMHSNITDRSAAQQHAAFSAQD